MFTLTSPAPDPGGTGFEKAVWLNRKISIIILLVVKVKKFLNFLRFIDVFAFFFR